MLCCNSIEDRTDREFMLWLYQEHEKIMFATAKKYVQDMPTCEVIVQDSLVKLIPKASQLRQYSRPVLAGYIVSTVKHVAIDHLRRSGRDQSFRIDLGEMDVDDLSSDTSSTEDNVVFIEDRKRLLQAWKGLPQAYQLLLEGKYLHGYSDEYLAQIFGCKPDSIRMKLTRARRAALNLVKKEGVR